MKKNMTTYTLNKYIGGTQVFSVGQLESVLTHLAASAQNEAQGSGVVYMRGEPGLLVADTASPVVRTLMYTYSTQPSLDFTPPIAFVSGTTAVSLTDALLNSGELIPQGQSLADTLSQNNMFFYNGQNPFEGPPGIQGVQGIQGPAPTPEQVASTVSSYLTSADGASTLAPLVSNTATSWLTANESALVSTVPGPQGPQGLQGESVVGPSGAPGIGEVGPPGAKIVSASVAGDSIVFQLSDGSSVPVAFTNVLSAYLTANPLPVGPSVQSVSVSSGGLLTLLLTDNSAVSGDLSSFVNAAIHTIVDPKFAQGPFVNSCTLSGNILTLNFTSGAPTVLTLAPSLSSLSVTGSVLQASLSDSSSKTVNLAPAVQAALSSTKWLTGASLASNTLTFSANIGSPIQVPLGAAVTSMTLSGSTLVLVMADGSSQTADIGPYVAAQIAAIVDIDPVALTGASLAGSVITFTKSNNTSASVTLPPTLSSLSVPSGSTLRATLSDNSIKNVDLTPAISSVLSTTPYVSSASVSSNALVLGRNGTTPLSVTLPTPISAASLSSKMLLLTTPTGIVSVDLSSLASPTLTQYSSDAAAAAALPAGSMYYDSTGLVKVVLQAPLIPLTTANILSSGDPVLVNTWDSAAKVFHFNSTGTAAAGSLYGSWGLSAALLTSLSFSWTAPWMFVVKCKSSGSNLRACLAIDPIANWSASDGLYTECLANTQTPYVYLRSSGIPQTMEAFGAPYVVVNNIPVDTNILSANGCFIIFSWNGTQAKIEFLSSTGSLIYSSQINRTMSNRNTPFGFYSDLDSFDFLKGLYFSQSYQPFSAWSSYFA